MFFLFDYSPYIAIIGDVKNSRNIKERKEFQNKLNEILNEINKIYSDSIASNFTITLGDEFQGLLYSGKNVMNIIQYIKKESYPVKIRFGVGIGAITTDIDSNISIGADGPGYYKARDSIEQLKILEKKKEKVQKEYMQLCASQEYLYLLKVPDKKALYARIRAVDELIHKFI